MTSIDLQACGKAVADKICQKVNKSIVFIDNVCAETLHWYGGLSILLTAGANNVKEYSPFESGGEHDRKAVFVISGPLCGRKKLIMRDIVKGSNFQYIIVVSTVCSAMHNIIDGTSDKDLSAFEKLEESILGWMGNMNYTVELEYIPLVALPVTSQLFLLPEHHNFFPLLATDVKEIRGTIQVHPKSASKAVNIEFEHLTRELQLQVKLLVCSLNAVFEQWSVSEDCYALGTTSRIIASELAALSWAKNRRKNAQKKASILLIDRTLDLANVCGHHCDNLMDRIISVLPKLPTHSTDVRVDMTPISPVPQDHPSPVLVPGCLAHPLDNSAKSLLKIITNKKQKEAGMEVNRQLVEAASSSGLPPSVGRGSKLTAQLKSSVKQFRNKPTVLKKHSGIVQLGLAAIQALEQPACGTQDRLLAVEKGLLQSIDNGDFTRVVTQLTSMVNKESEKEPQDRDFKPADFVLLVLYMYSLMDSEDFFVEKSDERILQAALLSMVLDDENSFPEFLADAVMKDKSIDNIQLTMENAFNKIRDLPNAREDFKSFRHLYENGGGVTVSTLQPLVKQVVTEIFNPEKPELHDIHYKSTGLRDMLKSGFGLFMNVTKPRPSDHPTLLIFIVGGTTCTELRQINEALSVYQENNIQVIVGSTSLLKPEDILSRMLAQDNTRPTPDAVENL